MSNLERLQKLMSEIGPLVDKIEAVDQVGEAYWLFAFGEDTVLQIQYDEQAHKLILFTDLGAPDEEHRLAVYEELLSFNYLWSETGGVRMAIEGPKGTVSQILDLFTLDLDASALSTVMHGFCEKAEYWRDFIAHFSPPTEGAQAPPPQDDGPSGPAIRV